MTPCIYGLVGLVSLFNGISTSVCYLMPKPSLKKKSSDTIQLIAGWGDNKAQTFEKNINPKANVIARLEFEPLQG